MNRTLAAFLLGASIAVAGDSSTEKQTSFVNAIYPYVVPKAYLEFQPNKDSAPAKPLGHNLYIVLVEDLNGLVRNVKREDFDKHSLTPEQAQEQALANLVALAHQGKVNIQSYPDGPSHRPFVVFGGHWTAATCILLPKLRDMGSRAIGTNELCVSIPHRDVLLMFAKGDRAYRDLMRAMIREKESDGRKPLTPELFELTDGGIREINE